MNPFLLAAIAAVAPASADANRAFLIAFGKAAPVTLKLEGEQVKYRPVALVDVAGTPVLVAQGTVIDAAHVTSGKVATIHFAKGPKALTVSSKNLKALESGSSGVIADVTVSRSFGSLPVIVVEGGGTWQGYTCDMVSLLELTPTGSRTLIDIPTYYDEGGVRPDGKGETITGKIANVVAGKGFDVRYTGSRRFTDHYVRRGDTYVREGEGESRMLTC